MENGEEQVKYSKSDNIRIMMNNKKNRNNKFHQIKKIRNAFSTLQQSRYIMKTSTNIRKE